jgi:hypothetical protein
MSGYLQENWELFSHMGIDWIAIGITGLFLKSDGNRGSTRASALAGRIGPAKALARRSNHPEIRVRRQRPSAVAFALAKQLRKLKPFEFRAVDNNQLRLYSVARCLVRISSRSIRRPPQWKVTTASRDSLP